MKTGPCRKILRRLLELLAMQVKRTDVHENKTKLVITAAEDHLAKIKDATVQKLGKGVKVQGFREGKAPAHLIEKNIDQQMLQSEFVEEAINQLYSDAMRQEKLRPIDRPSVTVKKFVPFTTLEFEAEVEILGTVKLPDYKKMKLAKPEVNITEKDITEVINNLKTRVADKKDVTRASKNGDEVTIDFKGVDAKKEPIKGADGKDYPIVLGSKTFIPGFEENIVGLKAGEEKTFTIPFPKDYGVAALASKKVTFTVTIKKIQEVVPPKVDDAFAAKAGGFKTVKELKDDIKKEVTREKQKQADTQYQNDLVNMIADKAKMNLPDVLVNEQLERLFQEFKQNLTYRGQTIEEFLKQEKKTEDEYKKELRPQAEQRVKIGLTLAEVSTEEGITVTPEELEMRLQLLKAQYQDPQMQAQLDDPRARQDLASQLITEKTVAKLMEYAVK